MMTLKIVLTAGLIIGGLIAIARPMGNAESESRNFGPYYHKTLIVLTILVGVTVIWGI